MPQNASNQQVLTDVLSGSITTQWLILELLDEAGVLPRQRSLAFLEAKLEELEPDLQHSAQAMPLRHLIRSLKDPVAPEKRRRWNPVVIEGGKADDSNPE